MKSDFSQELTYLKRLLFRLVILENKYFHFVFLIAFFPISLFAQNLVPNPSFETFEVCPPYPGQIQTSVGWDSPKNTTTDYFHICSPIENGASIPDNLLGYQQPATGNAYAGIRNWIPVIPGNPLYREYLSIQLLEPLQAGVEYAVQFKVSLAEESSHATDDIGAYFSKTNFSNERLYNVEPQIANPTDKIIDDQNEWTIINGTFKAEGGEAFLIIGTFLDDEAMTRVLITENEEPKVYYYVDDISVEACQIPNELSTTIDTIICQNSQIEISGLDGALSYLWNDQATDQKRLVKTAADYTVLSRNVCYDYTQTYRVKVEDCSCRASIPSPQLLSIRNGDNPISLFQNQFTQVTKIELYDQFGRRVLTSTASDLQSLDTHFLAGGLYLYRLAYLCASSDEPQKEVWTVGKLILVR